MDECRYEIINKVLYSMALHEAPSTMSVAWITTGMPHFKLKPRKISIVHNIRFNCPVVLKFCTQHRSYTTVPCAKFQKTKLWANEISQGLGLKCVSDGYPILRLWLEYHKCYLHTTRMATLWAHDGDSYCRISLLSNIVTTRRGLTSVGCLNIYRHSAS